MLTLDQIDAEELLLSLHMLDLLNLVLLAIHVIVAGPTPPIFSIVHITDLEQLKFVLLVLFQFELHFFLDQLQLPPSRGTYSVLRILYVVLDALHGLIKMLYLSGQLPVF